MWVLAHLLVRSRIYYVLKYLYEHELVWVCGWQCLWGTISLCKGWELMASENREDLKGLNCIMPRGLWKDCVAHRCLLSCSNLFFNLLYCYPTWKTSWFPIFKQQVNIRKFIMYFLIPLCRLAFSTSLRLCIPYLSPTSVVLLISN